MGHGTSALVSLRLRYVRELQQVRALLDLSRFALGVMYISLIVLLVTGVWAGFKGRWWDDGWIWASLGLLVAIIIAMYAIATPYYHRVRPTAGLNIIHGSAQDPPPNPVSQEELDALLTSWRPFVLAGIGFAGLVVTLWLMMFKPF